LCRSCVGLVSVLRRSCVGLASVLRRSRVGLVSVSRRSRVGLTSVSRRSHVGLASVSRRSCAGIVLYWSRIGLVLVSCRSCVGPVNPTAFAAAWPCVCLRVSYKSRKWVGDSHYPPCSPTYCVALAIVLLAGRSSAC